MERGFEEPCICSRHRSVNKLSDHGRCVQYPESPLNQHPWWGVASCSRVYVLCMSIPLCVGNIMSTGGETEDLNSHPNAAPLCPFSAPLAYRFHPPLWTLYCSLPVGNPIPPSLELNSSHLDNFCPRFSISLLNSTLADWWVALNSGEKATFPQLMPGFINITLGKSPTLPLDVHTDENNVRTT